MKKVLKAVALMIFAGFLFLAVIYLAKPLYFNWGASQGERVVALPGDTFVANPSSTHTVAITIRAMPEKIYPWILQIGAEQGGWYSFTSIEKLIQCEIKNADSLHPEWQNRKVGDEVKFCPGESGPPAYTVVALDPGRSMVLAHQAKDGSYVDTWEFALVPLDGESTRLLVRTRTTQSGGIWSVIEPGVFLMEYGMLNGIKDRAEG